MSGKSTGKFFQVIVILSIFCFPSEVVLEVLDTNLILTAEFQECVHRLLF